MALIHYPSPREDKGDREGILMCMGDAFSVPFILSCSESTAHSADAEPIRARGIIVK